MCCFRLYQYQLFQRTAYPIFLYVPTIGIAIICCLIIVLVKKRTSNIPKSKRDEKVQSKEKQAVLQLFLIIGAFLIGYIPFTGEFTKYLVVKRSFVYHINQ